MERQHGGKCHGRRHGNLQRMSKPGLYANILAKQERQKRQRAAGEPVERTRKPGEPGAPTAKAFRESAKTAKKA
jgi:hypothetical protein